MYFFRIYDISGSSDEKSEESEEESDGNDDSKMTKAVTGVLMVGYSSYDVCSQHECSRLISLALNLRSKIVAIYFQ